MTDESRAALVDSILKFGTQLGVPVLVLIALLYMAREAGVAVYGTAIVPLVKAHAEFLESTQETLKEIGAAQRQQAQTMEEIVTGQRELAGFLRDRGGAN